MESTLNFIESEYNTRLISMTPSLARDILERCNTPENRKRFRPHRVPAYARAMLAGDWVDCPGQVSFDTEGKLINGQHTLHAVVQAGIDQVLAVTTGCSSRSFLGFDSGMKRSNGQVLKMTNGVKYPDKAATVIRMALRYTLRHELGARWAGMTLPQITLLPAETCRILETNPHLIEAVEVANALYERNKGAGGIPVGATGTLLALVDHPRVVEFVERIALGYGLEPGDAALACRNAMLSQSARGGPAPDFRLAILIKGWQKWISGRVCPKAICYTQKETFPLLRDPRLLQVTRGEARAAEPQAATTLSAS